MSVMRRFRDKLSRLFRADIYCRLFRYVWPYKYPMIFVFVMSMVQTAMTLLDPWPMKVIIDSAFGSRPLPAWLVRVFPFLTGNGRAIVVFAVVGGTLLWLVEYLLSVVV